MIWWLTILVLPTKGGFHGLKNFSCSYVNSTLVTYSMEIKIELILQFLSFICQSQVCIFAHPGMTATPLFLQVSPLFYVTICYMMSAVSNLITIQIFFPSSPLTFFDSSKPEPEIKIWRRSSSARIQDVWGVLDRQKAREDTFQTFEVSELPFFCWFTRCCKWVVRN